MSNNPKNSFVIDDIPPDDPDVKELVELEKVKEQSAKRRIS